MKAIMPRDPATPPQRRRGGDKSGGGAMLHRAMRAAGKPAARGRYNALHGAVTRASNDPADWLHAGSSWDAFDITGFHYVSGLDDHDAAHFDAKSDHLSPGL